MEKKSLHALVEPGIEKMDECQMVKWHQISQISEIIFKTLQFDNTSDMLNQYGLVMNTLMTAKWPWLPSSKFDPRNEFPDP